MVPSEVIQYTSNSWHYSRPRSVYCRSIVFLIGVQLLEIYRFIRKIFKHIPYNRWDRYNVTGNARLHAQFQVDLHIFDQNILSFENSLFLTIRKDLIRSWIFYYFSFTFYIQFILFVWKAALEIKRTFDQFTLAPSSLMFRVVTWYVGSGLKAQNMTGIRAQRKGLRAQKNGIRDHKAFEPKLGIRFITFHLYYFSFYLKF